MPRKKLTSRRTRSHLARKLLDYEPPNWLSTEELEQELFEAVVAETRRPRSQVNFERIDAYFAADKPETEIQYRRSLLRLLAELRPQLAELAGGPRKCE